MKESADCKVGSEYDSDDDRDTLIRDSTTRSYGAATTYGGSDSGSGSPNGSAYANSDSGDENPDNNVDANSDSGSDIPNSLSGDENPDNDSYYSEHNSDSEDEDAKSGTLDYAKEDSESLGAIYADQSEDEISTKERRSRFRRGEQTSADKAWATERYGVVFDKYEKNSDEENSDEENPD